jgi:hypothetical protein
MLRWNRLRTGAGYYTVTRDRRLFVARPTSAGYALSEVCKDRELRPMGIHPTLMWARRRVLQDCFGAVIL